MSSSLPVLFSLFFNREHVVIACLWGLLMCCLLLPRNITFLDGACDSKIFRKSVSKFGYATVKQESASLRSIRDRSQLNAL